MAQQNNYQLLIEKLDQFIRKYYINQLIRGGLYSIGLILFLFLVAAFLEHTFFFDTGMRKVLFFSFIGISTVALAFWVLSPLLHYFRLGKVISHERAAEIVGSHFTNVQDKLLNVLQLKQQADQQDQQALILASINQKSEEIKPVPFKSAINLSHNRKYLRYALPPLMILLILLFAAPSMIKDSTRRLIRNGEKFERPAPFHFIVQEEDLSVVQYEDFPLSVQIDGEQLPNDVFINVDGIQHRLVKESNDQFSYRFNNVQKDTKFQLYASGLESDKFELEVLKKPNILGFEVKLDYPGYTQRKDETLNSIGDVVLPVGTNIDWVFNAENTDDIELSFSTADGLTKTKRFSDDLFTFKKRAMKSESYKLYVSNKMLPNADSIAYAITVIPDLYPTISAEKFQDSTDNKLIFFVGEAADDYGLVSLSFNYRINKENGEEGTVQSFPMGKPANKETRYDYTFDLNELALEPGDEVSYFFEVYDNDGVNGNKPARTNLMVFSMPTVDEYEAMAEANDEAIKQDLKKALEESKKIQEDMKKMREKLLQEKDLDWQSKKELEKLMERQENLEKEIEEAKEKFQKNLENQEEYTETDERIMEKQEQLEELFEQIMDEEMKELMEQIEELMEQLEKDEALEMMEDMEYSDEEMEKELDRLLELYKQMEMEQEMQETIDKLEELAEEQEKLSEETQEAEENKEEASEEEQQKKQEELEQKQEELNEEFEEVQEKMEKMEEKNEELENKKELGEFEEQMEDIQEQMENSQQELQEQQNSKASESQKGASEKMRQMAMDMAMQMQQGEMEQMQEDMAALRQLLENLVGLSFDQEDLIESFNVADINTPRYVELVQDQFKLQDDFKLIEDSLQALSKRVYQIESFVTEKVSDIKGNMRESLEELEERRKGPAGDHQQRAMKNVNDLALMLSEVMNQMQQQMSGMMSGNQMCNKPSGQQGKEGQKPSDQMGKGQEDLKKQLQNMQKQLGKDGKGGSSKEFAQMAAKQAALRKALQEKAREKESQGNGGDKQLQELIEQMDKVETDLVNKKLTNETMSRVEEIETRLLEHEKAERQREYEEKRKAETAQATERKIPPSLEEYIKKREAEVEMYKTVSPSLKPYYKYLVEEYFKSLKGAPADN